MAAAQQQEQLFSAMIWRVGTNGDAADDDGGVQTNGWPFYFLGLAFGIFGVCVDMYITGKTYNNFWKTYRFQLTNNSPRCPALSGLKGMPVLRSYSQEL